jgi:hypothetical protein
MSYLIISMLRPNVQAGSIKQFVVLRKTKYLIVSLLESCVCIAIASLALTQSDVQSAASFPEERKVEKLK